MLKRCVERVAPLGEGQRGEAFSLLLGIALFLTTSYLCINKSKASSRIIDKVTKSPMGRAVTISKIYRTCLNLKQFKMIKKRTVKQILCKSAFVFRRYVRSFAAHLRKARERSES